MKKSDIIVIVIIVLCLLPFFLFDSVYNAYCAANQRFPLWMAFLKFGILATFGEMLGCRVKTGEYYHKGFGIAPKFVVWGLLGMWIALAMNVFRLGVPAFMERYAAFSGISAAMSAPMSWLKLLGAFCVSVPFLIMALAGGMGLGDAKLMAAVGILLGWKQTLLAAFFGIVIGCIAALILKIRKKRGWKSEIPFGPFLCIGSYLSMLVGEQILSFYLSLL